MLININDPQLKILIYVFLAGLLGGVIGIDREFADKPAGLRTHILVASAASLLVGLSQVATQEFSLSLSGGVIRADPIRVIEAIITGVSVLGAGTIIRPDNEDKIEGLTTAASIFVAAAVGIAVALSQLVLAVGMTVLVLASLRLMKFFRDWLNRHH